MFYVEASLKKGGKFYLCWLAFTWPPLFEKVTNRQICLVNIEQTCDQLMFVFNKESGNPRSRFSLRLSSQLVFGIIKIYERQVKLLCLDLLQFESLAWKPKKSKSRSKSRPKTIKALKLPDPENLALIPQDHLEERLQQSGNAVANIEDITLKDAVIPEHQPPAEGFGEENPEQVLQMLQDQTMEMMLGAGAGEASTAGVSGDANLLDVVDRSKDVSALQVTRTRMEGIPELETPVFRKTIAGEDLEPLRKDSPIIPSPTTKQHGLAIQEPEMQQEIRKEPALDSTSEIPTVNKQKGTSEAHISRGSQSSQLADLILEPFIETHGKTKKKKKLIVDQKLQIDTAVFKHQITVNDIEVKEQDLLDLDMVIPAQILLVRPAHAGQKLSSQISRELLGFFHRRATLVPTNSTKDIELLRLASGRSMQSKNVKGQVTGALLRRGSQRAMFVTNYRTHGIEENNNIPIEENAAVVYNIPQELNNNMPENYNKQFNDSHIILEDSRNTNIAVEMDKLVVNNDMAVEEDIHLLTTQILRPKRRLFEENEASPRKRPKVSQSTPKKVTSAGRNLTATQILQRLDISKISDIVEPQQEQFSVPDIEQRGPDKTSHHGIVALDIENLQRDEIIKQVEKEYKKQSDSDETPLGSLDRTQVSLGDSNKSTNSVIKRIRENWNGPATCGYIVKAIKDGHGPLTVSKLLSLHPTEGPQRIIAALCFSSILRLHSKGYIKVIKKHGTNEIDDIVPGEQLRQLLT